MQTTLTINFLLPYCSSHSNISILAKNLISNRLWNAFREHQKWHLQKDSELLWPEGSRAKCGSWHWASHVTAAVVPQIKKRCNFFFCSSSLSKHSWHTFGFNLALIHGRIIVYGWRLSTLYNTTLSLSALLPRTGCSHPASTVGIVVSRCSLIESIYWKRPAEPSFTSYLDSSSIRDLSLVSNFMPI